MLLRQGAIANQGEELHHLGFGGTDFKTGRGAKI